MMWSTVVLAITLLVGCYAQHGPCPDSQAIYPCYCESSDHSTVLTCEKLSDLKTLKTALDAANGRLIHLEVIDSTLGEIPSNFFTGPKIENIAFDNCVIESLGDRPFSGLEDYLEDIEISESIYENKKDFETFPLDHLKKLKTIDLLQNNIKRMGNGWFKNGPQSLTALFLEDNGIEELGDSAFASLVNLEEIWLGKNKFKTLKRSILPPTLNGLERLDISFGELEVLPKDMFTGMPKLNSVLLAGNQIKSFPEDTWGNVWGQLGTVYVDFNPILCDEKIKWIYQRELPPVFHGQCVGDNELKGKYFKDLTLKDFDSL